MSTSGSGPTSGRASGGTVDVLVVGGGHNGLTAAVLAAQALGPAGRVTLVEQSDQLGGATTGERVFAGRAARLSRYSYLVSLLPESLVRRLGISIRLASRAVSSYTPVVRAGRPTGLLVERHPGAATRASFAAITGSDADFAAWQQLTAELAGMAAAVAPALLGPLRRRGAVRAAVTEAAGTVLWKELAEAPIGEMISRRFADDTVRGVIATDALIGTHASLFDPSLLANRCFLYHLVGRGTGEWLVPVGGMGALTDALVDRARAVGVELVTGVEITGLDERRAGVIAAGRDADGNQREWTADHVLAAAAPAVVDGWFGRPAAVPSGAQLKINMLLDRLPRLASGMDPAVAFAGTAHFEEGFDQLEEAYRVSAGGALPPVIPGEVYCHSLTDPSILGAQAPGRPPGATLTLFALHTPADLFDADPDGARRAATDGALSALQRHLAEPLTDCLARDADGRPCLDVATPRDLERSLHMPGGHIFHGDLTWPWLGDDEPAGTPAERYGVAVEGSARVLLAGAGSRRGGAVSGLGGAAAVDAWLEERGWQAGDP